MNRWSTFSKTFFILPFFLFALFPGRTAGFIAERIMAIVNNEVIALSDVREYAALFGGAAEADQKTVLDVIIGQKIFLAEAQKMEIPPPSPEEVGEAYTKLITELGGSEEFEALKKKLGLSDSEIHHLLRTRLHIEKLIDQRLRSFVFVTPRDVEAYLEANPGIFSQLPEEEKKNAVDGAIRKIKSQKKLGNYLERLKAKSDIQINFPR